MRHYINVDMYINMCKHTHVRICICIYIIYICIYVYVYCVKTYKLLQPNIRHMYVYIYIYILNIYSEKYKTNLYDLWTCL